MATKYCVSCGREIEKEADFCPRCGAKQTPNDYQLDQPYNRYNSSQPDKMSTNKILSFIALGLSIVSIVFGGLFAEIAAVVISVIVLNSNERCEPEAKTIAKIALIISIILMAIRIVVLILLGGMMVDIFDSIGSMYY